MRTEPERQEPKKNPEPAAEDILAETTVVIEEIVVPAPETIAAEDVVFEPAEELDIEPAAAQPQTKKAVAVAARVAKKGKRGRKSIKEMEDEAAFIEIPPDDITFKKTILQHWRSIGNVWFEYLLATLLGNRV